MMTAGLLGAEATTGGSSTRRAMAEEARSEAEVEGEGVLRHMETRLEARTTSGWTKKETS